MCGTKIQEFKALRAFKGSNVQGAARVQEFPAEEAGLRLVRHGSTWFDMVRQELTNRELTNRELTNRELATSRSAMVQEFKCSRVQGFKD